MELVKISETQMQLYKEIREITRTHHLYSDQMMAIAIWIDSEFTRNDRKLTAQEMYNY